LVLAGLPVLSKSTKALIFSVMMAVAGNRAFVTSKAVAGTSSSELSYQYSDVNMEKGISQYRIQQVDLDGKFSYSMIRAIRGESVAGNFWFIQIQVLPGI
jgi:hypothetical protein